MDAPGGSSRPVVVPLLLLFWFGSSVANGFELTLLHTNDVHARVDQTSVDSGRCASQEDCYGGVARRLSKIREVRAREPHVLLLDAGDQYQGTVWFNYYKGEEAVHFMNYLQYDAMALGNHEFDNGVEGLLNPLLKKVAFPILSANIKSDKQLSPNITGYYLPYKILQVGSEKVGIIGYTSKETPTLSSTGPHLLFEDEILALQPQVEKLRTLGVNKIIALGHSGFETDQQIAQKVKGVDVVIGGHTNTFLYTGSPPSSEIPAGGYPFMVTSNYGYAVPVVQAYAFGKYLGYLKVIFDDDGNVIKAFGNPILLNSTVPEDEELKAEVNKWKEQINNYSTQAIGKTVVYLNGTTEECRNRECNMGNLICDAMIYNNIRFPDEKRWNHVSLCILNGGSIRSPIDERSNNGIITLEDLISVLPFGGTFDLIEVKGSTLRAAFEHSVHRYGSGKGEFLQVGGIRVVYDLSKNSGNRVVKVEVVCTECRVPSYVPLETDKIYKVVLPSYIVNGGDGFTVLKNEQIKHDSGDLTIAVISSSIRTMERVYPTVEVEYSFPQDIFMEALDYLM
ncbi:5'-nucleotidase isoform X2 [Microcaecilia unicolor]|uniref:5'-nucleotidase n=1 Tax=Microcaecilia unicolor TaxID=1415580 RepID=A0A6P7XPD0_9AMPH|nr:5'-nucleotidase isoform X2 [Microcaecilia unicolor]